MSGESGWINIAIIGGGISGMAVAYELSKYASTERKLRIDIFERNLRAGGNIDSPRVQLGEQAGTRKLVQRMVDLGVNDINAATYKNIIRVMKETNFYDHGKQDVAGKDGALRPLDDSVCFYSMDGSTLYTKDGGLKAGVSDPARNLDVMNDKQLKRLMAEIDRTALMIVYGCTKPDPESPVIDLTTTLDAFFSRLIEAGEEIFRRKKREHCEENRVHNDDVYEKFWRKEDDKDKLEQVKFLRDLVYYPRISAMYFANDLGPESMLLAAPYRYYLLQEGVGQVEDEEACRLYFVGGASNWFHHLAGYLEIDLPKKLNEQGDCFQINYTRSPARVTVHGDRFSVGAAGDASSEGDCTDFQYCVMAAHADDAQQALKFEGEANDTFRATTAGASESSIRKWLSNITYTTSIAVAHTYARLLPPDVNAWRTYNVCIRQGVGLKPYSMTYVCNRHQNDSSVKEYDHVSYPTMFVTLNPVQPIPEQYVLSMSPGILSSASNNRGEDSVRGPAIGPKAIHSFKHNLLNRKCFETQQSISHYHDKLPQLFFTGGWSRGAGLHEECWLQGISIAKSLGKKMGVEVS